MPSKKKKTLKTVETLTHEEASRKNIPTAEYQSVMRKDEETPIQIAYKRRNRDLDPQLVWRGKDEQDWSDLVVHAPPLYIQEKVHPKVLIDDLIKQTEAQKKSGVPQQIDLFSDFNGLLSESAKTEFYQHDANWSNRMILGDSLQVMASLAEREGLRGKVQCIYLDPPYGIKFNSNFQWSTTSRDVKDGTETGWDPYLEDIASLWLCAGKFSSSHSTQCPGRRHSTSVRFSPSRSRNLELPLSTSPRMMPVWPQFPPVLMKRMQHVSFIRTHNQQKIGNEIRCPFNALGLIESIPENGHFRFAVGKQNTLPALIFLAACFSYAESIESSTQTLSLNQIVYGADSPCIAFKITETECGRLLEQRSIH